MFDEKSIIDSLLSHPGAALYEDYEIHGVQEYWMVDPEAELVEQYELRSGRYELLLKAGEGMIHSKVVQGFAIPIRAIFDKAANLAVLKDLLR